LFSSHCICWLLFYVSFLLFFIDHSSKFPKMFQKFLSDHLHRGWSGTAFLVDCGCESFGRRWLSLLLCACVCGSVWTSPPSDWTLGQPGGQVFYSTCKRRHHCNQHTCLAQLWIWCRQLFVDARSEEQPAPPWLEGPWDFSYSCRASAKLETDSSCPCVVFIQRFFGSVLWPPVLAALTACLRGARSFLAEFSCCAGE